MIYDHRFKKIERIELENGCYKEILRFANNKISTETYYNKEKEYHRLNKPATIYYSHETGKVSSVYYWINGCLHREDGPARTKYTYSGEIENEEYWLNYKHYTKEEFDKKLNIERNLKLLNKV